MINHFRTILLNLPGPRSPVSKVPSDIYIPEYRPLIAEGRLPIIDHVLFGDCLTEEDRIRKTYQLLKLVYASDLKERLVEMDSRITYTYENDGLKCYEDSTSIAYSFEWMGNIGDQLLEDLFSNDDMLFLHYNAKTYVDRLAAVIVGYVKLLEISNDRTL